MSNTTPTSTPNKFCVLTTASWVRQEFERERHRRVVEQERERQAQHHHEIPTPPTLSQTTAAMQRQVDAEIKEYARECQRISEAQVRVNASSVKVQIIVGGWPGLVASRRRQHRHRRLW